MIHDDDGTIVAYAVSGGKVQFWTATDEHASDWTLTPTSFKACCNDPIVWKAGGRWFATTAQHGAGKEAAPAAANDAASTTATTTTSNTTPATSNRTFVARNGLPEWLPEGRAVGNYGNESFFTSRALVGPQAQWQSVASFPSWFSDQGSLLIPGHPMTHEFVSPDFFQNISGDPTNDTATSVFMTSTYGPLADAWQSNQGLYNYAVFVIGSQPQGVGTPFVSERVAAVDWSPFSPHNTTPGGLDVAVGWGPTQYGCCPKTAADGPALATEPGKIRRVLLGWLQNGCSSSSTIGVSDAAENSLTLPRDVSLAADGTIRQRYVPELQQLRKGNAVTVTQQPFPQAGTPPQLLKGVSGAQIEVVGTVKFGPGYAGAFGLSVLGGEVEGVAEHTDIVFDLQRQQVQIDRRNSSARFTDTDVRAGPMPPTLSTPGELRFHAYVDHSIVTVIVENQTALTVWVHPVSPNSTSVGLFNAGGNSTSGSTPPVLEVLEVWQLASVGL